MKDNQYHIRDDSTLCTRKASWKEMMKSLNNEGLGFLVKNVCEGKVEKTISK